MSKKQVKTKKNVFGLVSKIGSLIKKGGNSANNIDSVETARSSGTSGSETPRKNFNIQISDDNQEIFAVGDDEEEEEEDEEEIEKEIKDKKEKENKDNINENIISDNKDNKIDKEIKNENINQDIKKETKENKNKNEIISVKEEESQKQNIKNSNLNDTHNINDVKNETKVIKDNANTDDKEVKKNDNNNISKNIEENNKKENNDNINEIKEENNINNDNNIDRKEENIINDNNKINNEEKLENSINENRLNEHFETCHLCLKKGNDFNSDEIYCIPIIRNKKKKSVLQKFGLFKKPKYDLVNYKIFFDECFIYLSKDIVIDKKNTNKRRINNVLKIKNIINFNTKKEQNNYFVTIDIYNKNGVLKNKEFFVEEKYFEYFNKEINKSLELYGGLYMKSKKL